MGFGHVLGTVLLLIAGTLALGMVLFYQQNFQFERAQSSPQQLGFARARAVQFTSEDGYRAYAWIVPPQEYRSIIFYFGGNYTSADESFARVSAYHDAGYGVAMLFYRGMPEAGGKPSEKALMMDARALYDRLDTLLGNVVPPERRVVHGFSLGSAVASHLATERPVAAVVLEATFTRLCEYFSRRYRGAPMCWLMWKDRFPIINWIGRINAPLLVVHGGADNTLPVEWARNLFAAAREPKTFRLYERASHADLPHFGMMKDAVAFVGAHAPPERRAPAHPAGQAGNN
jgi:dipeptidyl aminopeptidase/acylaminoacyl peptidase